VLHILAVLSWLLLGAAHAFATDQGGAKAGESRNVPATPTQQLAAPVGAGAGCGSDFKDIHPKVFDGLAGVVEKVNAPSGESGAVPAGIWWNVLDGNESGWGILMQQRGDTIAGWWYALGGNAPQRCWLLTTQRTAPGVYTGNLFRVSNDTQVDATGRYHGTNAIAGTVRFTVSDANNAKFEYALLTMGPRSPAMQSRAVTRVALGPGATVCPQGICPAETCRLKAVVASIKAPGCVIPEDAEDAYQSDADIFRARHLVEWARIIEEYQAKTGRYPLQHRIQEDEMFLVQIATREQHAYLDPSRPTYVGKIDNMNAAFTRMPVKDFVADIERGLGREIDERYDPQRAPYGPAPIYLSYLADRNGYVIWAMCRTCKKQSTSFSTLLTTGMAAIGIGTRKVFDSAPEPRPLAAVLADPEFVEFTRRTPGRPGLFELLEREQIHDSKK